MQEQINGTNNNPAVTKPCNTLDTVKHARRISRIFVVACSTYSRAKTIIIALVMVFVLLFHH